MAAEKTVLHPIQRVQDSYKKLESAAIVLNSASDKLGKPIADLDAYLKKLGLGISSFVKFRAWDSSDGSEYSYDELGYAKLSGKWGLAIRNRSGRRTGHPDDEDCETWVYNEAPRLLRVQAVKAIPELLDKLFADATKMAETVEEEAKMLSELTDAMGCAAGKRPTSACEPPPGAEQARPATLLSESNLPTPPGWSKDLSSNNKANSPSALRSTKPGRNSI
jgi:hypothetical protein